jgi:RNA polymerase sigma-70 factor (ECF subfamily)
LLTFPGPGSSLVPASIKKARQHGGERADPVDFAHFQRFEFYPAHRLTLEMPDNEMTGDLFLIAGGGGDTAAAPRLVTPAGRLVERIRGGDEEAFGELYKMFALMVHGILLARVPREEVDDMMQDVFISAHKSLATLRDKNAVGGWMAMIARNRAAEFFRQARQTEELPEISDPANNSHARAGEILSAIRSCPEAYRETLVLRLVEGMTGPEIAERTGLTPESVRVNLHRGIRLLRQKLGIEV